MTSPAPASRSQSASSSSRNPARAYQNGTFNGHCLQGAPRAPPVASGSNVKVEDQAAREDSGSGNGTASFGEDDDLDELKEDAEGEDGPLEGVDPFGDPASVFPPRQFGYVTIKELLRLVDEGTINLSPSYQRPFIWDEKMQEFLIDTLFRGIHIPALVFSVVDDQEVKINHEEDDEAIPRRIWNVTDGKQRISTIAAFVRGSIQPIHDSRKRFAYRRTHETRRGTEILSKGARDRFDAIEIRYAYYEDLSPDQEVELFKRIQAGKRLSTAEEAFSVQGVFGDYVKGLVSRYCDPKSPTSLVPRIANLSRTTDFLAMARIVLLLQEGLDGAKFRANDQIVDRVLPIKPLPTQADQQQIIDALERFKTLTLVPKLPGSEADFFPAVKKRAAPGTPYPHQAFKVRVAVGLVELPCLLLLVRMHTGLRDGLLLEAIESMLAASVAQFRDELKLKKTVFEWLVEWIRAFDPTTLTHKYNDDGSLRVPPAAAPRAATPVAALGQADPAVAALYRVSPTPAIEPGPLLRRSPSLVAGAEPSDVAPNLVPPRLGVNPTGPIAPATDALLRGAAESLQSGKRPPEEGLSDATNLAKRIRLSCSSSTTDGRDVKRDDAAAVEGAQVATLERDLATSSPRCGVKTEVDEVKVSKLELLASMWGEDD